MRFSAELLFALLLCACHGSASAIPGTQASMDFARASFWDAPYPSDDSPSPAAFPIAHDALVGQVRALAGSSGFPTSAGVFFSFSDALSVNAGPQPLDAAFLFDTETGARIPAYVTFRADGGRYGPTNQLAIVPLQGAPLRPNVLHAAVVLRSLNDAAGKPLGVPLSMAQLAAGVAPRGLSGDALQSYRTALRKLDVPAAEIAAMAAFTTGDPGSQLGQMLQSPPQPHLLQPFSAHEVFDDFCVFQATIAMPSFQQGVAPYTSSGGGWGATSHFEESNLVVTVPRTPMPSSGFPTAVFIRTGGGGDRPLVDRGPQAQTGGPAIAPGTGPALHFARAGFAGVSVDGPLGGLRNPTGDPGNEDFLIFNVQNPIALRDNIRESAFEIALLPAVLDALTFDASSCGGPASVKFDTSKLALMGHSMGATIAPLTLWAQPRFKAALLSGAGGSWIENVLYKLKPLEVKPVAEALLDYQSGQLFHDDAVLSLLQWAAEPADPQVYAPGLVQQRGLQILMMQGIVDNYILPRIANALSLPLGLDLAGTELDQIETGQTPFSAFGRPALTLPVSNNANGATAVLVQFPEDGIEDGHEVVFQSDAPKHLYRCFLQDFANGLIPTIRPPAAADATCN
jgi:hypothetical protein